MPTAIHDLSVVKPLSHMLQQRVVAWEGIKAECEENIVKLNLASSGMQHCSFEF